MYNGRFKDYDQDARIDLYFNAINNHQNINSIVDLLKELIREDKVMQNSINKNKAYKEDETLTKDKIRRDLRKYLDEQKDLDNKNIRGKPRFDYLRKKAQIHALTEKDQEYFSEYCLNITYGIYDSKDTFTVIKESNDHNNGDHQAGNSRLLYSDNNVYIWTKEGYGEMLGHYFRKRFQTLSPLVLSSYDSVIIHFEHHKNLIIFRDMIVQIFSVVDEKELNRNPPIYQKKE